jgi:hypothetical protein
MSRGHEEYPYQPQMKYAEELRQRINNAGFSDEFKQQIKSAQKEEGRKMFERLTNRQTIKHADGTEHIETYCHGHRYGPAAFPSKYGTSAPQEYKNYCEMVDRLAAYEDSGLSPEEIKKILGSRVVTLADDQVIVDRDAFDRCIAENERMYDELQELAKAKADGRLLVLPVKAGDTVYIAVKEWDARYCLKSSFVPCVREGTVAHICISHKGIIVCVTVKGEYSEYYEFGKTVFLTREAAEKALGVGE